MRWQLTVQVLLRRAASQAAQTEVTECDEACALSFSFLEPVCSSHVRNKDT